MLAFTGRYVVKCGYYSLDGHYRIGVEGKSHATEALAEAARELAMYRNEENKYWVEDEEVVQPDEEEEVRRKAVEELIELCRGALNVVRCGEMEMGEFSTPLTNKMTILLQLLAA